MKTRINLIVIAVLLLTIFSKPLTASAESPLMITRNEADAFFLDSPDECISTEVNLSVGDFSYHSPPNPKFSGSRVSLSIYRFDSCTGTELLAADGSVSLADGAFQISPALTSAILNATVSVFDYVSGASFDVFMNLSWAGVGRVNRSTEILHRWRPSGCPFITTRTVSGRVSEVSGSILVGSIELISQPAIIGHLGSSTSDLSAGCSPGQR